MAYRLFTYDNGGVDLRSGFLKYQNENRIMPFIWQRLTYFTGGKNIAYYSDKLSPKYMKNLETKIKLFPGQKDNL